MFWFTCDLSVGCGLENGFSSLRFINGSVVEDEFSSRWRLLNTKSDFKPTRNT